MGFNFNSSFSDITSSLEGLFGTSSKQNIYGTGTQKGTNTSQLQIDKEGIMKTLTDLLEDPNNGMATIFGAEKSAGLYGSSGAKFGANDLAARIAGTLAQLTGKTVNTVDMNTTQQAKTENKKKGLLQQIFSDERLKTNIKQIGTLEGGIPWYSYEINGVQDEGVLAQEVLIMKPDAVYVDPQSGLLQVNYSKLPH